MTLSKADDDHTVVISVKSESCLVGIRHPSVTLPGTIADRILSVPWINVRELLTSGRYLDDDNPDNYCQWTVKEITLCFQLALTVDNAIAAKQLLAWNCPPDLSPTVHLCSVHPEITLCNRALMEASYCNSEKMVVVLLQSAPIIFTPRDLAFCLYSLICKFGSKADVSWAVVATLKAGANPRFPICPSCTIRGDCYSVAEATNLHGLVELFRREEKDRTLFRRCAQLVRSCVMVTDLAKLPLPEQTKQTIQYLQY